MPGIIAAAVIMEYDRVHKMRDRTHTAEIQSRQGFQPERSKMERKISDWGGNIVAFAGVVLVNWLANALPIAGTTTGAVSDKYSSLFTPAGFTFAIWGVIYGLLAIFIVYQALPALRRSAALAAISPWFKVSCVANALWLISWHLEWLTLSLLLMTVLLICLVNIYRRLEGDSLFAQLPFSVYSAWIAVATIANVSAVQSAFTLNEFVLSAETWTLLKLAGAIAIAAVVGLRRSDAAFPFVIAWAAYGIAKGQGAMPAISAAATASCLTALLIAGYVIAWHAFSGFRPRTILRESGSTRGNHPPPSH